MEEEEASPASASTPRSKIELLRQAGGGTRCEFAVSPTTGDDIEESMRRALESIETFTGDAFFQTHLQALQSFVYRYNVVRATAPTLIAMGPAALDLLAILGFAGDSGYLSVGPRGRPLLIKGRQVFGKLLKELLTRSALVQVDMDALLETKRGAFVFAEDAEFSCGVADMMGRRDSMEDDCAVSGNVFALFDGHAGDLVAKMSAALICPILKAAQKQFDNNWKLSANCAFRELHLQVVANRMSGGCTALLVQISKLKIFVAHAGDSRAILVKQKGSVERLTEDHKPDRADEKSRIMSSGGEVTKARWGNVSRLNGEIAVSRSIGDVEFTQFGLTHEPECCEIDRDLEEENWLILACDGIWDVMSDSQVAKLVYSLRKKTMPEIAKKIIDKAFAKLSSDNLSCIVVHLPKEE